MEKLASLLQGIASLLWVAFAFVLLFRFAPQIGRLLDRLKKGKFLGQEIELEEELATLQTSAVALADEVKQLPRDGSGVITNGMGEFEAKTRGILEQAATSPKVALMTLSAELEKQAIHGLAARGLLNGRPTVPLSQALIELRQYGFPPILEGSLNLFEIVRNKIIHGADATDEDALKALDSGIIILKAVSALPREVYVVSHPGVDMFSDSACTMPFRDIKGVLLEVTSPGGVSKRKSIFPTTLTHFKKGKQVAWEWGFGRSWPAAWYRDPDTQEIKSGWGESLEFRGRHLDDIPGSARAEL